jgi:hypothetical protein
MRFVSRMLTWCGLALCAAGLMLMLSGCGVLEPNDDCVAVSYSNPVNGNPGAVVACGDNWETYNRGS